MDKNLVIGGTECRVLFLLEGMGWRKRDKPSRSTHPKFQITYWLMETRTRVVVQKYHASFACNIPYSRVWRVGFSGSMLCGAASKHCARPTAQRERGNGCRRLALLVSDAAGANIQRGDFTSDVTQAGI